MPHMGPASEASMLDKVVAIASDPVLHKRVLGEFKERQKLAQDAEAKARDAEGKAAAAEKKAERAEKRLAEKVATHDTNVYEAVAGMAETTMKMDKARQELENDASLLRVHEEQLTRDRAENSASVNRLMAQTQALAGKDVDLIEREDALAEQAEAIRIREGKFANRLREFNEGL